MTISIIEQIPVGGLENTAGIRSEESAEPMVEEADDMVRDVESALKPKDLAEPVIEEF